MRTARSALAEHGDMSEHDRCDVFGPCETEALARADIGILLAHLLPLVVAGPAIARELDSVFG
jgi:hypothetical protein